MRIILEGCDKVGKTTLGKYLKSKLLMKIIKFSAPKGDAYTEYKEAFKTLMFDHICDRFWVGENVYGPIYRGKGMSKKHTEELDNLSHDAKDIIIFCNTDINQIKINFEKEGEEFTKQDDIEKIQKGFIEVLSNLKTDVIYYDYRLDNMEAIYNIIKDRIIAMALKQNQF